MTPRHLVFDLDGTLVDSVGICAHIANDMLEDRGHARSATIARTREYISVGGERMIAALLGVATRDPVHDIQEFRRRYALLPTPQESLYPHVRATLESLATLGHTLSICSNKPQPLCEKVLTDLHLGHLFAAVVGTSVGKAHKPDPEHLDRTLRQAGGTRARCHYIGDSIVDLNLTLNANVPFICVAYGYGDFESLPSETTTVIDRFEQLLPLYSDAMA